MQSAKTYMVLLEALGWLVIGAIVGALLLRYATPQDAGYVSRVEGTSANWTKQTELLHVVADSLTWFGYIVVGVAIARLHPIMARIRADWITVSLIVFVFSTLAGAHLVEAMTMPHPSYWESGWFKLIASMIGLFGAGFIAHELDYASRLVRRDRLLLQKLQQQYQQKGT